MLRIFGAYTNNSKSNPKIIKNTTFPMVFRGNLGDEKDQKISALKFPVMTLSDRMQTFPAKISMRCIQWKRSEHLQDYISVQDYISIITN